MLWEFENSAITNEYDYLPQIRPKSMHFGFFFFTSNSEGPFGAIEFEEISLKYWF